uniref:Uncharacterized protein n=1 Tax=Schistosoma haematobium TaxID=6185 RepID=A0A095BUL7_SCHHA
MNLYFSSVASQQPGHSSLSKMNTNTKHTNNQMNNPTHSCKQHVTLSNALDLFTGNNITSGIGNRNSFSIAGNNHIRKLEETTPVNIVLRRASNDSPWGFRVQGGSDYHLQLTICKYHRLPYFCLPSGMFGCLTLNMSTSNILISPDLVQKLYEID